MQKVILDLLPGGVAPIVYASQYDDRRSIRFMLTEGGPDSQYSLNASDVITCNLTKPDGTETVIAVANPGGGEHYVDLVNGADDYDQAGAYLGEIVLTRNTRVIGSANFVLKVEEDAYGGQITTLTATGNPCNFTTDIADALVSLTADIVCGGGGGTPSTPIPIVGHSELNLTRCGVNFLDNTSFTTGLPNTAIGSQIDDIISTTRYAYFGITSPKQNVAITASTISDDYFDEFYVLGYSGGLLAYNSGRYNITSSAVIEDLSSYDYIRVVIGSNGNNPVPLDLTGKGTIQLELGTTPSAFEPYNGDTFTVAFGQTVYGGVYDKSGRLTITHSSKTFIGSADENWSMLGSGSASAYCMAISISNIKYNTQVKANYLESILPTDTWGNYDAFISYGSGDGNIYTGIRTITTVADWKTHLSNNPLTVCYELATPIEIDVQAISPSAENGTNTITSDCIGDVDVTYIKKV